ncbi:LacI family DNA-binding transcriptional regulator [Halocella sp. SP3-1]|uniref:LacI family DNA-binding transcriptional regulator n=1 Tax=Halocella sp. SP3-1 TaxID=2382161 RepID=UPI000F757DE5|nr:LacI family DNA-binding transcriptional regulator [Halocella sp. SP3-1]AZO96469.1 LacI family transcriptional regulator [Halocella sp. SP3-1]
MVTLKDIADRANVSSATVSYVLNNSAQISKETREKVLKIVEELDYKGNKIAKSLRTNKTNTIGVIVEDMTVFNSPKIIDGINEYVEQKEFHIILSNLRLNKKINNKFKEIGTISLEIEKNINDLLGRQIDGIIYIGEHPRDVTDIVGSIDKPVVYTYCYTSREDDYKVNYDDKEAAYQATNYLIEAGHEEIAVISGLIDSYTTHLRLQGYQQALADNNLVFNPAYIKTGDWTYETGYKQCKELLTQKNKPTAIFAFNDLMAAGVIEAAAEMGIDVPEEISVIGFDNREFSSFCKPKLTTIALPLWEMGIKSAQILINIINEEQSREEVKDVKLECNLIERESILKIN